MKPFLGIALLVVALRLAAQETETAAPDDPPPTEESQVSPFWEVAESDTHFEPSSTVTPPAKIDPNDPPGPTLPVMGHVVVFRTEDRSVVLEAVAGGREAESALFARLHTMEQEGAASVAMEHQIMTLGGRRASTSAIRTAVYPTDLNTITNPLRYYATGAFEARHLGDSVSITPRFRNNGLHVLAQAAAVRWGTLSRWPLIDPDVPPGPDRVIFCLQPQILVDECITTAIAQPGQVRLLGIAREARQADDTSSVPAWRLAFLRMMPLEDTVPSAQISPEVADQGVRCDLVAFRVPLDEAATWVTQDGPRDVAEAWDQLMTQARTGEVIVAAQWSIAAVTGPVRPGGPPEASVTGLGEFIYPTEHDHFIPTAFETRNTGSSCRFRLRAAADGRTLVGVLDTEEVRLDRLRRWPSSANEPELGIRQPEFVTRKLRTDIALPANGVAFVGMGDADAFGASADGSEAMADLYFVKTSADPLDQPANAPKPPVVVEWSTLVVSLDDSAASEWHSDLADEAGPAIEGSPMIERRSAVGDQRSEVGQLIGAWVAEGHAPVRHAATVVVADGGSGSVTLLTEVTYPTASRDEKGLLYFGSFDTQETGLRLSVKPTVHADRQTVTAALEFGWASAPPRIPDSAGYRQAVEAGSSNIPPPEFFDPLESTRKSRMTLTTGTSHLLFLEKARVPVGSPDYGRWHAVIVSAVVRGG